VKLQGNSERHKLKNLLVRGHLFHVQVKRLGRLRQRELQEKEDLCKKVGHNSERLKLRSLQEKEPLLVAKLKKDEKHKLRDMLERDL
jgi:hypothetical protein